MTPRPVYIGLSIVLVAMALCGCATSRSPSPVATPTQSAPPIAFPTDATSPDPSMADPASGTPLPPTNQPAAPPPDPTTNDGSGGSELPADVASSCADGPTLDGSDVALACHPGVPEAVYFWHFTDPGELIAAFTDLTSNLGQLTPVNGNCSMSFNGDTAYSIDGAHAGFVACPQYPPSDIAFLYLGGTGGGYLTWSDLADLTIGLVSEPSFVPAGLFNWWQREYPNDQVG